jgi:hypothetical protein
MLVQKKLIHDG